MNKFIITRWNGHKLTAILSDGELTELSLEDGGSSLGNIYIGKVKNVVKNLNSAFVEYAKGQNGYYSLTENPKPVYANPEQDSGRLKAGDEILVQISKDAVKTKDPVLTSNLNFTGTYAVLTAGKNVIGFSAKIQDREWKNSLRPQLEALTKGEAGLIVRTNAYEADPKALLSEICFLMEEYQKVLSAAAFRTCYSLLYQAEAGYIKMLDSCSDKNLESVVTDDEETYQNLNRHLQEFRPELLDRLHLYQDSMVSLLQLHGLEKGLEQALQKRVWLKSGGYLVIEQTEAMVVIDVNTGKYAGKKTQEAAIRKINLEAAEEICRQLRLRNLSGIIMIDFIDMKSEEDRALLMDTLKTLAAKDPVKTTVIDMTPLNLVELTRKKGKRPLAEQIAGIKQI